MSETKLEIVKKFLAEEKIVLIEPSSSFAQTVMGCLTDLGAKAENIFYAKKYSEAANMIAEHKPKILVTEYFVGQHFGISLIEKQLEHYDDTVKIAVLVTHNGSASAIAEAAEEHVDAYVLKPFSSGDLKERLLDVIFKKGNPSPYGKKIQEGKTALKEGRIDEAAQSFMEAKELSTMPTLALYYLGHSSFLKRKFDDALKDFQKGLKLQPLHYRCLTGEFDSLFEQKKYAESYELISNIRQNYPISANRLGNIFICTVFSNNLEDVPTYYDLYLKLDHRPRELTKIFSAALLTAGKFYVKANNEGKAQECFEMGVQVTGPEVPYLDSIIRELLKLKAAEKAKMFLMKFPRDEFGGKSYSHLSFLIDRFLHPVGDVIERGRKLVAQGYADAESYRVLVKLMLDNQKKTLAEDVAAKAVKDYPDLRSELYGMIEAQG